MQDLPVFVLLSGGIDSTAAIHFYLSRNNRVEAVHIQYDQSSGAAERRAAETVTSIFNIPLLVMNLGFTVREEAGEYFGRNALFVLAACAHLPPGPKRIALGIHSGTPYYDCSQRFVKDQQAVLDGYFAGTVVLDCPFLDWSKGQIYEYCRDNQVPVSITHSCERSNVEPCGNCPSCLDRRRLYGH